MLGLHRLPILIVLALEVLFQSPHELLRRSDVGLFTPAALRTVLVLKTSDSKTHHIEVWRSGDAKTLIRFLDTKERGKYLVRLGDQLWLIAPGAKRAVRLNSSYRIYGASALDEIMGLRLGQHYTVDRVEDAGVNADALVRFYLRAKDGKALFPTVEYVVRKNTERPVSALYYLRSGKPATSIEFNQWTEDAPIYARQLLVKDLLRKGALTEVIVSEFDVRAVPDALFDLTDSSARRALERGGSAPLLSAPEALEAEPLMRALQDAPLDLLGQSACGSFQIGIRIPS